MSTRSRIRRNMPMWRPGGHHLRTRGNIVWGCYTKRNLTWWGCWHLSNSHWPYCWDNIWHPQFIDREHKPFLVPELDDIIEQFYEKINWRKNWGWFYVFFGFVYGQSVWFEAVCALEVNIGSAYRSWTGGERVRLIYSIKYWIYWNILSLCPTIYPTLGIIARPRDSWQKQTIYKKNC
jgi:hypothetical protein